MQVLRSATLVPRSRKMVLCIVIKMSSLWWRAIVGLPKADGDLPPSGEVELLDSIQSLLKMPWYRLVVTFSMKVNPTSTCLAESLGLAKVFIQHGDVYIAKGRPIDLLAKYCQGNLILKAVAAKALKDLTHAKEPVKKQYIIRYYRYLILRILKDIGYTVPLPIKEQLSLVSSLVGMIASQQSASLDFLIKEFHCCQ